MQAKHIMLIMLSVSFCFLGNAYGTDTPKLVASWHVLEPGEDIVGPRCLTTDSQGNVYVTLADRVKKFSPEGKFIQSWGSLGKGDGQFYSAYGIAADSNDYIYVSSNDGRIQKFTNDGFFVEKFELGEKPGGQAADSRRISFDSQNNVYVAETSFGIVEKFTSDGKFLSRFNKIGGAWGAVVDSEGNAYLLEGGLGDYGVLKYDKNGNFMKKIVETNEADYSMAVEGKLHYSWGIAIDRQNNMLYVADTADRMVQAFTTDGKFVKAWDYRFNYNDAFLTCVAVEPNGNLAVSDYHNKMVYVSEGVHSNSDNNTTSVSSQAVPEFGPLAFSALAISLVIIIFFYKKMGRTLFKI